MTCNLERRLKFESGLTIGTHLIALQYKGHERRALVKIGKRGAVYLLAQPREGDMYGSWQRVRGDKLDLQVHGGVIVWPARDPQLLALFDGAAVPISMESAL